MCNKAIDNYPHALEFVPECYKTQERNFILPDYFTTLWNTFFSIKVDCL